MAVILHLDTEQAALIEAALEFGVFALEARAARVDPDRIISDSHKLQAIKLQQVQQQMRLAPSVKFSEMSDHDKAQLEDRFRQFLDHPEPGHRDTILQAIETHCDECRLKASKP